MKWKTSKKWKRRRVPCHWGGHWAGERGADGGDKCPKGSVKVSNEKRRAEQREAEGKQSKAHRGEKLKQ